TRPAHITHLPIGTAGPPFCVWQAGCNERAVLPSSHQKRGWNDPCKVGDDWPASDGKLPRFGKWCPNAIKMGTQIPERLFCRDPDRRIGAPDLKALAYRSHQMHQPD